MTDRRPGPREHDEAVAPATGIAAGGLGTAANLEDTQVIRTEDLRSFQAAEDERRAASPAPAGAVAAGEAGVHAPEDDPRAATPAVAVAAAPVQTAAAHEPISEPVRPVASTPVGRTVTRRSGSSQGGRALAGVLAAALVVLAGVAFVTTRDDGTAGAGETVPSIEVPATAEPDANVGNEPDDAEGHGDGDADDDDRDGKGKGKHCEGNGRGHGCGGGGGGD